MKHFKKHKDLIKAAVKRTLSKEPAKPKKCHLPMSVDIPIINVYNKFKATK